MAYQHPTEVHNPVQFLHVLCLLMQLTKINRCTSSIVPIYHQSLMYIIHDEYQDHIIDLEPGRLWWRLRECFLLHNRSRLLVPSLPFLGSLPSQPVPKMLGI